MKHLLLFPLALLAACNELSTPRDFSVATSWCTPHGGVNKIDVYKITGGERIVHAFCVDGVKITGTLPK